MPKFLVIYRPGPSWLAGKPIAEQPLAGHFAYMEQLYSQGILRLGGPFLDDSGAAAVLEADDLTTAQQLAAHDPAVVAGVAVVSVHGWQLAVG
ncbi:MAG: YciI family protein [Chloroflexaceae bacterium]|nr:YciI family protein [Chloroflexaceae bacterium]